MRLHGLALAAAAGIVLINGAIAAEVSVNKSIHPLTGHAPAELVPIVRDPSASAADVIRPTHFQSVFASAASPCGSCGAGAPGCGEGCVAPEYCGDCCLCGDTPLLSCLRNRKSCFSDDVTYSVGGEIRHRYMDESNRLRPGGPASSDYNLWRITPFASLTYDDTFTGYVQAIDASAFGYDAPLFPLGIDVNRSDLLQYYGEINLGEVAGGNLKYRYGRQFLKYGNQHLLSPLGWSNTFRNFEGHKMIWTGGDWTIDAFSMASVNGAANGAGYGPTSFDTVDSDRQVHGVYGTYSGIKNNTIDAYWIWSDVAQQAVNRQDGNRHTFGLRAAGSNPVKESSKVVGAWNWDVEGAVQVGKDDFTAVAPGGLAQDVFAGFFSATGGYAWKNRDWSPTLGGIFYWGSGDSNPNDGTINTVYTLYPLGHAYWGLIDNFSGQNLLDYGIKGTIKPHKKLTLLGAFHWFDRATANDAVYNIAGAPFANANAGSHIGNELDIVATYKHSETLSIQLGHFWFWYGGAINGGGAARPDASQFYAMTTLTF